MKKTLSLLIIILLMATMLSACRSRAEPRILLDDEYLQITQTGGKIDVYDVESNMTYTFYIRHKKPSNRVLEAYTAIDTPTLRIEKQYKKLLLTVKKSKEVFTISIGKMFPVISVFKGGERI